MPASHTHFLHVLRKFELERVLPFLPPPGRTEQPIAILEVGAGTGYQAKFLSEKGYAVTAIDINSSAYSAEQIYPIIEYDGRTIPASDAAFQVVFSSNVLEHVRDIGPFLVEMRRTMASGARAIHVLPTPAWRFWTMLTHYIWLGKRVYAMVARRQSESGGTRPVRIPTTFRDLLGTLFPLRHGERGVTVTEMYFYSQAWWVKQFQRHGYEVLGTYPTGLFYTGSFAFGSAFPISWRRRAAGILGSACRIYVLQKLAV